MDKKFDVGDLVYLRLQGYQQKFVQSCDTKELSKRFFGPFKILECIGQVAYRLELPPDSRIHPVFHISLLRQEHDMSTPIPLPPSACNIVATTTPTVILKHQNTN